MHKYNTHDLLASPDVFERVVHGLGGGNNWYTSFTLSDGPSNSEGGPGTAGAASPSPSSRMQQNGVHLCRLAPHTQSVPIHAHSVEDEWILVVSGGEGAHALIRADMSGETVPHPLRDGDFLAFPAGLRDARAMRAGERELVYIVGGTRSQAELCVYPEVGKTRFRAKEADGAFLVDDKHIQWRLPEHSSVKQ